MVWLKQYGLLADSWPYWRMSYNAFLVSISYLLIVIGGDMTAFAPAVLRQW